MKLNMKQKKIAVDVVKFLEAILSVMPATRHLVEVQQKLNP